MTAPARRAPHLALPYPALEYFEQLPGDYMKIALRLLRAAQWTPGTTRNGIALDVGEALIDERSEELWGSMRLDRETGTRAGLKVAGRRALVRRVLERLEADGWVTRRSSRANSAQASGPRNGPRNGPSPTVVRWLKFREILWPVASETAQETAQVPAQETARSYLRTPPEPPSGEARAPAERQLERLGGKAEVLRSKYPRTAALMERLSFAAEWARDAIGRDGVERAIGEQDLDDVASRVETSFAASGKPWLGWHREAIQGAGRFGAQRAEPPPALDDLRAQLERAGREEMAERGHPEAPRLPGKLLAGARAARLEGDALVLEADRFAGNLLEDARESVERWGSRVAGRAVRLEVRTAGAALAVAGSAA